MSENDYLKDSEKYPENSVEVVFLNASAIENSSMHTHLLEGMPVEKRKKKEVTVRVSFFDRKGNFLGNDPKEVLSKLTQDKLNQHLAFLLEARTGIKHIPGK